MGCMSMTITMLNTEVVVAGFTSPTTAAASAVVTPPIANVAASSVAQTASVRVSGRNAHLEMTYTVEEVRRPPVLAIEFISHPKVEVTVDEPPVVVGEILSEKAALETSSTTVETAEIQTSLLCAVGEEEIYALSAVDQILRTADGGYLRINPEE